MKGAGSEEIIVLDKKKIQDTAQWLAVGERTIETRPSKLSQG